MKLNATLSQEVNIDPKIVITNLILEEVESLNSVIKKKQ